MRPFGWPALGIVELALNVGKLDLDTEIETEQERAGATIIKVGGRINHGLVDAVKSVDECARMAELPAPGPCNALPCGWVVNASCWSPPKHPCWHTLCQIPNPTEAEKR